MSTQTIKIPTGATEVVINTVDTVTAAVPAAGVSFNTTTPPTNQPPTANAGADITITLPSNSVSLVGTGSDPEGGTLKFLWEKTAGGSATITNPSAASTTATGLVQGSYVFRLTVTDNQGASTFDTRNVTVNPEVVIPPTTGNLTFSKNYDSTSELSLDQKPSSNLAEFFSTTIKKDGTGSFKSFTKGVNTSSGVRCEEQYTQAGANPTEGIIEYDSYYENYKQTGWGGSSIQWHPNNNNSANVFLYTTEGKFTVARNLGGSNIFQNGSTNASANKSIESNRWYHFKWEIKWSTGSDGYVKLAIDGAPYYSFTGRTQDSDGKPYLKVGQNNWGSSTGPTIYYDNLRIYTK
jgi:hypothetical protein